MKIKIRRQTSLYQKYVNFFYLTVLKICKSFIMFVSLKEKSVGIIKYS